MLRLTLASSRALLPAAAAPRAARRGAASHGPDKINSYDSATFTTGRRGTKLVCKQKPVLRSRWERFTKWMAPDKAPGHEFLDTVQLGKVAGYLAYPVFVLMWWKGAYLLYPEAWEEQFAGLQARPNKEQHDSATDKSYFDVIDQLESRRDTAMKAKGY
jgi:hypothetical protein